MFKDPKEEMKIFQERFQILKAAAAHVSYDT